MNSESRLREKIKYMESVPSINRKLDRIISGDKNSVDNIRSYYKKNRAAYKRFHSDEGFMHFRVSKNGKLSDDDIYYQPNVISEHIKSGANVVELGSGMGANLLYLAKKHPDASFTGVDLCPAPIKDMPSNVRIIEHDYGDMPMIADDSVDVVYAVETIVHCSDKEKVFGEVRRILKPDGVLIVYDYALQRVFDELDETQKKAVALISKGAAAALIESAAEWERHFEASGLIKSVVNDLSKDTMPDLKRLASMAERVLERRIGAWFFCTFFPLNFVGNIIVGYLGYDSFREGLIYNMEWIYRK